MLLGADDRKEDPAKKERDQLKGSWKVVSVEGTPEDAINNGTFTFEGEKLVTTKPDGQKTKSDYKLAPAKKPKEIDIIPSEGPHPHPHQSSCWPGLPPGHRVVTYELKAPDIGCSSR